jgi:hypothetical protein
MPVNRFGRRDYPLLCNLVNRMDKQVVLCLLMSKFRQLGYHPTAFDAPRLVFY